MLDLTAEDLVAIGLSVKVASVATLVALPFAAFIGYALARWRFPGRSTLNALVHLPLVLPPVVTGFALLMIFGRQGPLGDFLAANFGIVFAFRWTGAALAAAVMSFPLMVRPIRLAFENTDARLATAARSLGANRIYAFALIELPLAAPGILVGAILGFAKALGEFGATITFVASIPGETRTIPAAIYALLQTPDGDSSALRLALIAAAIATLALFASEALQLRLGARK